MSHSVPSCPKCQQPMQTGYVVDRTDSGSQQTKWFAGTPRTGKIFGLSTGSLHFDEKLGHSITCFRCSACSYLEFYAYSPRDAEAETMLLRPAQETQMTESKQLLRGSPPVEESDND